MSKTKPITPFPFEKEKETKTFSDPEVREMIVDFFTNALTHSYQKTKLIRIILKSQNLTVNDIIIPAKE